MATIALSEPHTGHPGVNARRHQAWAHLTWTVAVAVAMLIGSRFIVTRLLAIGFPIAFALAPVWWPVVKASRWARTSLVLGAAAALNGVGLAVLNSGHRPVDVATGIHLVIELAGVLASAAAMVWVIRTIGLGPAGIAYALGMLANARPDAASNAADPLRFAYGTPLIVLLVSLAATSRRRGIQLGALVVGIGFSLFMGGRSVFGALAMALLILVAWYRPNARPIRLPRMLTALGLAGAAAAILAVAQWLILQGVFGQAALSRTQDQIAGGGNLLLGGRPEIGATWALMRDRIWGYGTGVLPGFNDIRVAREGLASIGYDPFNGYVDNYMFGDTFRLHSMLGDVWAVFGVLGAVFIAYCMWQAVSCFQLGARPSHGDAATVVVAAMTLWNAFFSPWYASVPMLVLFLAVAWTRQMVDDTDAATITRTSTPKGTPWI